MDSPLLNRRLLVVEDEYYIAIAMRNILEAFGSIVVGTVGSVVAATRTIRAQADIDAVILDINLHGVKAYPVADLLTARGIPFILVSAFNEQPFQARYPQAPICRKPFRVDQFEAAIAAAFSTGSGEEKPRPLPSPPPSRIASPSDISRLGR